MRDVLLVRGLGGHLPRPGTFSRTLLTFSISRQVHCGEKAFVPQLKSLLPLVASTLT